MKKNFLEKSLEIITIIMFFMLIGVVFLQVFSRFLLPKTPSWTEEMARFFFVYSILFGAPLALKKGDYVRVDLLTNLLPEKIQNIIDGVIYLVLTVFFIIIAVKGYVFASLGVRQYSPAMGLPMFIPYMSIGISSIFLAFYSALKAKERFQGKGKKSLLEEYGENKEVID